MDEGLDATGRQRRHSLLSQRIVCDAGVGGRHLQLRQDLDAALGRDSVEDGLQPNLRGSGDNALLGVWTRTSKDAFAVGSCLDFAGQGCAGHFFAAIFMHWNGAHWLLQ